jgi:hypothetical protein
LAFAWFAVICAGVDLSLLLVVQKWKGLLTRESFNELAADERR